MAVPECFNKRRRISTRTASVQIPSARTSHVRRTFIEVSLRSFPTTPNGVSDGASEADFHERIGVSRSTSSAGLEGGFSNRLYSRRARPATKKAMEAD